MKRLLVVLVALVAGPAFAFAQAPESPSSTCGGLTAQQHTKAAHDLIDASFAKHRWRHRHPLGDQTRAEIRADGSCGGSVERYLSKTKSGFFLYRAYREITPYRCQDGAYGTWSIPCSIISCESGFSWGAHNPSSSAAGPYQILVGRIYPATTRRQQLQNHERAAEIWRENGPGAWVCA